MREIILKYQVYASEKLRSNILNTRDSVSSGYPNIEKRIENTTRSGLFVMNVEVLRSKGRSENSHNVS